MRSSAEPEATPGVRTRWQDGEPVASGGPKAGRPRPPTTLSQPATFIMPNSALFMAAGLAAHLHDSKAAVAPRGFHQSPTDREPGARQLTPAAPMRPFVLPGKALDSYPCASPLPTPFHGTGRLSSIRAITLKIVRRRHRREEVSLSTSSTGAARCLPHNANLAVAGRAFLATALRSEERGRIRHAWIWPRLGDTQMATARKSRRALHESAYYATPYRMPRTRRCAGRWTRSSWGSVRERFHPVRCRGGRRGILQVIRDGRAHLPRLQAQMHIASLRRRP